MRPRRAACKVYRIFAHRAREERIWAHWGARKSHASRAGEKFITRAPGAGAHELRLRPGEIGGVMYILYVTHAPTRARRAPPMPRPGRGRARGPGAGRGAPTTVPPGPVPPPPRRRAPLRPPPRPQRHGATPKLSCSLYSSSSSSSSSCVKSVHVGHSPSSSSASDRCASPKTFRG